MTPVEVPHITPTGEIRCPHPGCRFVQRHVDVTPGASGPFASSHRCERNDCKRWMTILYQVSFSGRHVRAKVLEVHPRLGRTEEAMRRTYEQFVHLRGEEGEDLKDLFIAIGIAFGRIVP